MADIHDRATAHVPTRIIRRRARPAVIISEDDLRAVLATYEFSPDVLFEASGVAIWLPELAIWGRGATFREAKQDLFEEVEQILALYDTDERFRSSPATIGRRPWILRAMGAGDETVLEEMLFAEPS